VVVVGVTTAAAHGDDALAEQVVAAIVVVGHWRRSLLRALVYSNGPPISRIGLYGCGSERSGGFGSGSQKKKRLPDGVFCCSLACSAPAPAQQCAFVLRPQQSLATRPTERRLSFRNCMPFIRVERKSRKSNSEQ
jgi:hypothetical protein